MGDLKLSHADQNALEDAISTLEIEFGKEVSLTITRGSIHEYLGMTINFLNPGKVIFSIMKYINQLIAKTPKEL